jgi:16S rRNA processing protein RimM
VLRVIAKLIGFHGLKGELKLQPKLDDLSELDLIKSVTINARSYEVQAHREHKNFILLKVAGIDDLTAAEKTFNPHCNEILVYAELSENLEAGEFYLDDLRGMSMIDSETGLELGTVEDCTDGLQTLLVIRLKADGRELLVPLVAEYIMNIDTASRAIRARITADLLELAK